MKHSISVPAHRRAMRQSPGRIPFRLHRSVSAPVVVSLVSRRAAIALLLIGTLGVAAPALAEVKKPWQEYERYVTAAGEIQSLGPDLFGDAVSLQNGALSFTATDVSLSDNSSLPVQFTRRYTVFNREAYSSDAMLADWTVELPRVSGVFAPDWLGSSGSPAGRCSDAGPPPKPQPPPSLGGDVNASVWGFWEGIEIHIPGVTGGELLVAHAGLTNPDGGTYPWTSADHVRVSCLPQVGNATGEGFLAIAPDGTRYWFDWMAQYRMPGIMQWAAGSSDPNADLQWAVTRRRNVLYATRVEDRFGNTVHYHYDNAGNEPGRLRTIQARDAQGLVTREITVEHGTYGIDEVAVTTPGAPVRRWHYAYAQTESGRATLTSVTRPDTSAWAIDFAAFTNAEIDYHDVFPPGEPMRGCHWLETPLNAGLQPVGHLTHPSGASGAFTTAIQTHGRSSVPLSCANVTYAPDAGGIQANDTNDDVNLFVIAYQAFSLIEKQVSGPGLTPAQWTYRYDPGTGYHLYPGVTLEQPVCTLGATCYQAPCTSDDCAGRSVTTVTGPEGEWRRYTFGNTFKYDEGLLLKEEVGTDPTAILRATDYHHDLTREGRPYPASFGRSLQLNSDSSSTEFQRPQQRRTITQQGETFQWQVADCAGAPCFDAWVRPTRAIRASSLGDSKTEVTAYHDDLDDWVLGQLHTLTVDGVQARRVDYNDRALPIRSYAFGLWQQGLTYRPDGTLATHTDGNDNVTGLDDWKRGVPQTITYPDGTTETAVVADDGTIAAATDENGWRTDYDYDAMGRLTRIDPPDESDLTYHDTTQAFVRVDASEYGIPAGHWRQTVATGNARKIVYFDAAWRPLLVREYDAANVAATQRFTRFAYDAAGRTVFASYPSAVPDPDTGVWTGYDALGRTTAVSQDSEYGLLITTTGYLDGLRTRITDPRGQSTTTGYRAYDRPTHDWPIWIDHPEGLRTDIERNGFDHPEQVTRSGPGA